MVYNAGLVVDAEVAQLVERNLAKVEVESSRLFFRSSLPEHVSSKRLKKVIKAVKKQLNKVLNYCWKCGQVSVIILFQMRK
jgi:hypothetical protein